MSGKGHLFKPRGMLMGLPVPGSPKPKGSQVEPEAEEVEEEAGIDLEGIEVGSRYGVYGRYGRYGR